MNAAASFEPATPTLERIRGFLAENNIDFREVRHGPTYTSEEAARARGEELRMGGKALLMKVGSDFSVFVLPGNRRVDSAAIRDKLRTRKMRFATADELMSLTGLVPGSVPPFGQPILPFPLYVDAAIQDNPRIAFNAGSLTNSMTLRIDDYLRVAAPGAVFSFSQSNDDK